MYQMNLFLCSDSRVAVFQIHGIIYIQYIFQRIY